eukprot:1629263-Prymnesium_polylepis.1
MRETKSVSASNRCCIAALSAVFAVSAPDIPILLYQVYLYTIAVSLLYPDTVVSDVSPGLCYLRASQELEIATTADFERCQIGRSVVRPSSVGTAAFVCDGFVRQM